MIARHAVRGVLAAALLLLVALGGCAAGTRREPRSDFPGSFQQRPGSTESNGGGGY
ncbi:MAG: hypothetical protein HYV62_04755 [Candidatus Rokubacteria bacterium]|nr:hypothetical protein [Candidatus Rokubacteria bacterium]